MLHLIKKLFGIAPSAPAVEAPYKVETTTAKIEPLPAGTEAVMVAPNAVVPEAVVSAPVADKKIPKPRAPAKPKAPRKPAAK